MPTSQYLLSVTVCEKLCESAFQHQVRQTCFCRLNLSKNEKKQRLANIPLGKKCKYAPLFGKHIILSQKFKSKINYTRYLQRPSLPAFNTNNPMYYQCVIHVLKVSLQWKISLSVDHVNGDIALQYTKARVLGGHLLLQTAANFQLGKKVCFDLFP